MKTILKKKGFWLLLAVIALAAYLAFGGSGREDVIGGADGPTAIFVGEEEESEPFAVMPANPVKMTG